MVEQLHAAIGTHHLVNAGRSGLAAIHAKRATVAAIGEDAGRHWRKKADAAHPAVAPRPAAATARVGTNGKAVQPHRKTELQNLRVGQPGIGHVGLHHACAAKAAYQGPRIVEHAARTTAARNGFVILVAGVAEREVVHGALAGRHHAQRSQQGIGDAGGGFHIARHHRGRWKRVEHGAGRDDHIQRLQAPGVQRDVILNQRAKHIQHRRHAHRRGRIEVVALLRAGAGEVDGGAAAGRIHLHGHADLRAVVQGQRECAVLEARDGAAHRFLRVVLHMAHVGLHHGQAELLHHLAKLLHALFVGGNLRFQVGQVLLRVA